MSNKDLLDIDPSNLERKLLLTDQAQSELEALFPKEDVKSKLVKPTPVINNMSDDQVEIKQTELNLSIENKSSSEVKSNLDNTDSEHEKANPDKQVCDIKTNDVNQENESKENNTTTTTTSVSSGNKDTVLLKELVVRVDNLKYDKNYSEKINQETQKSEEESTITTANNDSVNTIVEETAQNEKSKPKPQNPTDAPEQDDIDLTLEYYDDQLMSESITDENPNTETPVLSETNLTTDNKSEQSSTEKTEEKAKVEDTQKAKSQTAPGRSLWVSGLSHNTRANDLKQHFLSQGRVVGAKVVSNSRSSNARCYGYIIMSTIEEADKCVKNLHHSKLLNRFISVTKAKSDKTSSDISNNDNTEKDSENKDKKQEAAKEADGNGNKKNNNKNPVKKNPNNPGPKTKKEEKTLKEKQMKNEENKNKEKKDKSGNESSTSDKDRSKRTLSKDKSRDRDELKKSDEKRITKTKAERVKERIREEQRRRDERRREERLREERIQKQRERERLQAEQRRMREEAAKLDRERYLLRVEREKLQREKAELIRIEKEQIEKEREELRKQKMKMEEAVRKKSNSLDRRHDRDRKKRDRSRSPMNKDDMPSKMVKKHDEDKYKDSKMRDRNIPVSNKYKDPEMSKFKNPNNKDYQRNDFKSMDRRDLDYDRPDHNKFMRYQNEKKPMDDYKNRGDMGMKSMSSDDYHHKRNDDFVCLPPPPRISSNEPNHFNMSSMNDSYGPSNNGRMRDEYHTKEIFIPTPSPGRGIDRVSDRFPQDPHDRPINEPMDVNRRRPYNSGGIDCFQKTEPRMPMRGDRFDKPRMPREDNRHPPISSQSGSSGGNRYDHERDYRHHDSSSWYSDSVPPSKRPVVPPVSSMRDIWMKNDNLDSGIWDNSRYYDQSMRPPGTYPPNMDRGNKVDRH